VLKAFVAIGCGSDARTFTQAQAMNTEISAVICTHNQARYLRQSLASLVAQELPRQEFEIIVVDNGSTDNTREVVEAYRDPGFVRYIYEPVIGLSQARNTGWKHASGTYVAYLDDDSIAQRDWLARITDAFRTVSPQPVSVGGRIMPIWEAERPAWLLKEMETYIGIINWSLTPMFITDDRFYLPGSNISYSRSVLEKNKGFNTHLGRKGRSLLSNEEICLQRYLRRSNLPIWYDPEICIYHHVKPECLRKEWFFRRYYWQGASDVMLEYQNSVQYGQPQQYQPRIMRDALYLFLASKKYVGSRLTGKKNWMLDKCWAGHWLGRLFTNTRIAIGRI
jgi:glycosyltransferase involved in cell wall biosynthesis